MGALQSNWPELPLTDIVSVKSIYASGAQNINHCVNFIIDLQKLASHRCTATPM